MTSIRIEICGGIASGKTTLARLLRSHGIPAALENFKINPFWKKFYENPAAFSFETEVTFLLQHYHQIKASSSNNLVCDFSFVLDRAYVDVTLRLRQRVPFLEVYHQVLRELGPPRLLIHLVCSPQAELARIRQRARKVERGIEVGYLSSLNRAVERNVRKDEQAVRVLRIDSEKRNFATDRQTRGEIVHEIMAAWR